MRFLTLTPDQHALALAGVLLAGCSGMALSSRVQARWLKRRGVRAVPLHVLTLAATVSVGTLLFGAGWLGPAEPGRWPGSWWLSWGLLNLLAAVAIVGVAVPCDLTISRAAAGRRPSIPVLPAVRPAEGVRRVRPTGLGAGLGAANLTSRTAGAGSWVPATRDRDLDVGPGWLVATAVAEECAFRGLVLHSVLAGPGWVAALGVPAVVAAFALSHIFFGWAQVLAKLPLSVLATAAALALGSVLAAAVGHALFNAYAWHRRPRTMPPPVTALP
jgi:membrane protease YdiL (CAAX protease family)